MFSKNEMGLNVNLCSWGMGSNDNVVVGKLILGSGVSIGVPDISTRDGVSHSKSSESEL